MFEGLEDFGAEAKIPEVPAEMAMYIEGKMTCEESNQAWGAKEFKYTHEQQAVTL